MYDALNYRSKVFFERVARLTSNKIHINQFMSNMFNGMMKFSRGWKRADASYCEVNLNIGSCSQPNGKFCSDECWQGYGLTTRCPEGYQPSHSWGFRYTGCWCDTYLGRNVVCCDCTPSYNSPYVPSSEDCGCMHYLSE